MIARVDGFFIYPPSAQRAAYIRTDPWAQREVAYMLVTVFLGCWPGMN